jgi:hypothetical protein
MTECLVKRGFREDEIAKVLGGNLLCLVKSILKPRGSLGALGIPAAIS